MLNIKYYPQFKDNFPKILIIGNYQSYLSAKAIFESSSGMHLDNRLIFDVINLHGIEKDEYYATQEECREIAMLISKLLDGYEPSHLYFDLSHSKVTELIFSYNEYSSLP